MTRLELARKLIDRVEADYYQLDSTEELETTDKHRAALALDIASKIFEYCNHESYYYEQHENKTVNRWMLVYYTLLR